MVEPLICRLLLLSQNQISIVDNLDVANYPELLNKWHALWDTHTKSFYAKRSINGKLVLLHRYLMNVTDPKVLIDHVNGNTLDNRFSNLRIVTARENQQNQKSHRNGKLVGCSKMKGNLAKPWIAYIKINGIKYHLGCFKTELEAHEVYVTFSKNV